jgi:predicted transcriptional regulator
MNIKQLKKELGLTNNDLARFFGLKSGKAFYNSSARKRYEESFIRIYEFLKEKNGKAMELLLKISKENMCSVIADEWITEFFKEKEI